MSTSAGTAACVAEAGGRRISLFRRYFRNLFVAMAIATAVSGASDAWFGYRDQRAQLDALLRVEARSAADRIQGFVRGIREALGWTVQFEWAEGQDETHRIDALRVLRQVSAITALTLVDGSGRERVSVSRLGLNRVGRGADVSSTVPVIGAVAARGAWYSPVTFENGSEPYMTIALAGNRTAAGVAVAKVNLKLIWDVVNAIRVGKTGYAFVLDGDGRLIAHPELSLVLRGDGTPPELSAARREIIRVGAPVTITDASGVRILAVAAPIPDTNWAVVVAQPLTEAFRPIREAAWRAAGLLLLGISLALALAYNMARRMVDPIRVLEAGVQRIGAGQFGHRITLATGDELGRLAGRINEMASELAASQEKTERIARLRRFLAPQVAELVEHSGDDRLLDGQRREVVAIFGDLRGFTAFAARATPEAVMNVLDDYFGAIGPIVTDYGATLTGFAGDGFMLLLNAPVPCPDPAVTALRLAADIQTKVQALTARWHAQGNMIGFGMGLTMGPATVGRIGYEGRLDYTAIGNVVNLAARLCAVAADGQILCDAAIGRAARIEGIDVTPLGPVAIRGYEGAIPVFAATVRASGLATISPI